MHTSAMHTFHCWNSSGPPWLRANKCILIVIHPITLGCERFVRKLAYHLPCETRTNEFGSIGNFEWLPGENFELDTMSSNAIKSKCIKHNLSQYNLRIWHVAILWHIVVLWNAWLWAWCNPHGWDAEGGVGLGWQPPPTLHWTETHPRRKSIRWLCLNCGARLLRTYTSCRCWDRQTYMCYYDLCSN